MNIGLVHTVGSPCRCAEYIGRGLRSLGHDVFDADANAIEVSLGALAAADVVFDHTDYFQWRGFLRGVVRQLLEQRGARVAGGSAAACSIADDKAATRRVLSRAGIPVAPGATLDRPDGPLPDLPWPRVLKATFEHMSRGVVLVRNERELREQAGRLFAEFRQQLVVEQYVEGREVGVTVIGRDRVLPPIEWKGEGPLLTWERKMAATRESFFPTSPPGLEKAAVAAFRALGLRDYARFDVRIDASGAPVFLEANARPSLEEDSPTVHSAAHAGLSYADLLNTILASTLSRRPE